MTQVDRATRCIVGYAVVWERRRDGVQALIEQAPPAARYFSDALELYDQVVYYPGRHTVAPGKSQTYSVEADNAEVRHYLARLARRSRCFSRSIDALRRAIKLFVHAWNRRQLHRQRFPAYVCHVRDFV